MDIIPAIIPESFEDLAGKLRQVKGLTKTVQIDITDGKFVPDACWPFTDALAWSEFERVVAGEEGLPFWEDFDFEADLMIEFPERNPDAWIAAGFSRVVLHVESTKNLAAALEVLYGRVEIGLALNIATSETALEPFMEKADFIQCMGIETIGFQGQPFDERVIPKIKAFRKRYPGVTISVDGGVSLASISKLEDAGASRFISGSAVFGTGNPAKAIRELMAAGEHTESGERETKNSSHQ
ncbi:MAG TPA: hypothetical protein VFM02_02930 [Candidatus Paceibacterota bacterium]|nr:hypothetical protein [Candidatus Paceibacterota bacterium]